MRDINQVTLLTNEPLVLGGSPNVFGRNFPVGLGWYKTRIRIRIATVIGTGAGLITDSALKFVKNIFMKSDLSEIFCNMSALSLNRMMQPENRSVMFGTSQVPAATGNTDVFIEIPHSLPPDWFTPTDTILDTARYKSLTLQLTLGTIADLFSAPGTATVTATISAEAITTMGVVPEEIQPSYYRSFYNLEPVVPTVQTFLELDRAEDMSLLKFMIGTTSLATAGVAFTGDGSNIIINDFDVKDLGKFYQQTRLFGFAQCDDKSDYALETVNPGITFIEFAKDRSVNSALYTGNKKQLRLNWRNGTAIGTDQVSIAYDAVRKLVG